jgi:two-component system, OmpR family, response regulator ResD
MKEHIIIYADDEKRYRNLVTVFLDIPSYRVLTADTGQGALDLLGHHPNASLLILDVMMPPPDGWETCRLARSVSDVPILMVTALGDEKDEVFGLENGADDYISKPFSRDRLLTRVRALIRRGVSSSDEGVTVGNLFFDSSAYCVRVDRDEIVLTPKEFLLLDVLVRNRGQVMERRTLLDRVWGFSYCGDPRTLDTHIKSLRAKLKSAGGMICTRRNIGYQFVESHSHED